MAKNITGNHDGDNGKNESYSIPGRGSVSRKNLVKEVKAGKHPDFSTYTYKGEKFVRGNPDSSQKNNVNK